VLADPTQLRGIAFWDNGVDWQPSRIDTTLPNVL
jgi:hypothetical protein